MLDCSSKVSNSSFLQIFKSVVLVCAGVGIYFINGANYKGVWISIVYSVLTLLGVYNLVSGSWDEFLMFSYFMGVLSMTVCWYGGLLGQGGPLYFLLLCLLGCFFTDSLLVFYICFELALIPLMYVMVVSGSTPERVKAAWGMFLYTLAGSLPFLFQVVLFYVFSSSYCWFPLVGWGNVELLGFWGFWVLAFFVKVPVFGLHSWLPVAHGEAPTYGSMVLGAMMLKLGVVGLFRVLPLLLLSGIEVEVVISWAVFGFFCSGLLALSSKDLKMVVAYSSVVHLSPVMVVLFLVCSEGMMGSIYMGVGHGYSSSMLFLGVGLCYGSRGFRSSYLVLGSGLMFCVFWFLGCAVNASMPPSINYFSEVFMFYSCFCYGWLLPILMLPGMLLSGVYSLLLYTGISHGPVSTFVGMFWELNLKGTALMSGHMLWSILFVGMGLGLGWC